MSPGKALFTLAAVTSGLILTCTSIETRTRNALVNIYQKNKMLFIVWMALSKGVGLLPYASRLNSRIIYIMV